MKVNHKQVNQVLIVGLTPYFLERGSLWFQKNFSKIKKAHNSGQSFWGNNVLILGRDEKLQLSELLRKLDDLRYEKTRRVLGPGEFSLQGGTIDIFPIGSDIAYKIEFLGNQIENIYTYPIKFSEEEAKRDLKRRLDKESLRSLKPGDYLVHLDHGIGKYVGVTKPYTLHPKPYYTLEYAAGDKLYVPVGLEEKLSRYIGFIEPKISRLGSPMWQRTKKKVKEDIIKTAKELLILYAKREISKREPYEKDDATQGELESLFPFQETSDQIKAIEDIKRDLVEKEQPMDRVICGDVGLGKTEVALRAAFKVVLSGKQVVMLCPTTILADQHYHTFKNRLEKFAVEVNLLSRLQSKSCQKEILANLKFGKTDILVGTHRLLSKDVEFSNLGLVIIDEEQKFGVRQKEKFKAMRSNIDILSLSATPIPRTLYLSLSNLREISLIQTPPPERVPIKTFVSPWSKSLIKGVCEKEIERGGQIYYLHNRVETIAVAREQIHQLIPGAKIGIAHGRMPERELVEIMHKLRQKRLDILVATTIIENGLDLPNVNTLIVDDATRLGLSQAYQIRGRIGRSHIQAYAYFLYSSHRLSEKAFQRLEALKEAEELGSGYQIALRDLEIRGAGNILGKEQSGSINKVGLNLYCQMLSEAVEEMKDNK